jgi:hypothetical protein
MIVFYARVSPTERTTAHQRTHAEQAGSKSTRPRRRWRASLRPATRSVRAAVIAAAEIRCRERTGPDCGQLDPDINLPPCHHVLWYPRTKGGRWYRSVEAGVRRVTWPRRPSKQKAERLGAPRATNTGRFGALSTDMGRLEMCWGNDGDTFTIRWTERDRRRCLHRSRFGTVVIEAMAQSLNGKVSSICALGPDLALDLPSSERAGAEFQVKAKITPRGAEDGRRQFGGPWGRGREPTGPGGADEPATG